MRTLSRMSSAVSDESQPVFFSARPTEKPGVPFSTMNIDMSRLPLPVFAATKYRLACTPLVMNILVPLSTHSPPPAPDPDPGPAPDCDPGPAPDCDPGSRRAVVRIPATSEPAPGSEIATAVIRSPEITRGR